MKRNPWWSARGWSVLVGLLVATRAWPCGPDFPLEFLSHRAATLAFLPDGLFDLEAERLVDKPAHAFAVVEYGEPQDAREGGGARERELYLEGAAFWHQNHRDLAASRFRTLLQLPEAQRKRFTIPAEFMLARATSNDELAASHYEKARAAAEAGFDDALGLALASLGEEARLALWRRNDARAVELYALQAAHGSRQGRASLLFVARLLVADQDRLAAALVSPVVQRLMAAYVWSRGAEAWWADDPKLPSPETVLARLAELPSVSSGDLLAAALYRAGRYEDAEHFARGSNTAVAHWVLAKLALRAGRPADADAQLAEAAQRVNIDEDWGSFTDYRPRQQIEVERAILALGRDQFDEALLHLQASCSWQDIAWVAERVVDVDSLKRAVDAQPAKDPCRLRLRPGGDEPEPLADGGRADDALDDGTGFWGTNQPQALRRLLARRLLRQGRGPEAFNYFDSATRPHAEAYVAALEAGRHAGNHFERARQLMTAAELAAHHGFEMLSTEVTPDYRWTGGDYDPFHEEWGGGVDVRDAGLSAEEQRRFAQSAPADPHRFHYRHLASHLAEEAANQVDPRSQAFTALLCRAAKFVADRDDARVRHLWRRSVKEGPLLSEPMVFARDCPEPRYVDPKVTPKPFHLRKRWLALGALGLRAAGRGGRRRLSAATSDDRLSGLRRSGQRDPWPPRPGLSGLTPCGAVVTPRAPATVSRVKCAACSQPLEASALVCPSCGTPVQAGWSEGARASRYRPRWGSARRFHSAICRRCPTAKKTILPIPGE